MTDFQKVTEEFKILKEKFQSGLLSEAEFKSHLDALMQQDEQGKWWMIGYETGLWYYNDGTNWVIGEPPGNSSAEMPTKTPSIPGSAVPAPESPRPAVVPLTHEFTPPLPSKSEQPTSFKGNPLRYAALILGVGIITGITDLIWGIKGNIAVLYIWPAILLFPLTSILFGPWVGGLAGLVEFLSVFIYDIGRSINTYGLSNIHLNWGNILFDIVLLSLCGVLPSLLVKNPKNWKSVAIAGGVMSLVILANYIIRFGSSDQWANLPGYIIQILLDVTILPLITYWLIGPVRKRGWYWRDQAPKTH